MFRSVIDNGCALPPAGPGGGYCLNLVAQRHRAFRPPCSAHSWPLRDQHNRVGRTLMSSAACAASPGVFRAVWSLSTLSLVFSCPLVLPELGAHVPPPVLWLIARADHQVAFVIRAVAYSYSVLVLFAVPIQSFCCVSVR